MPGVIRPPYGEPTGPSCTDDEIIARFVAGDRTGHSEIYHIEERVLIVNRFVPLALRLGPGAALIRGDMTEHDVAAALPKLGYTLVSSSPDLAVPVAMQAVGLRDADWELWCIDEDEGWRLLEVAAFEWV